MMKSFHIISLMLIVVSIRSSFANELVPSALKAIGAPNTPKVEVLIVIMIPMGYRKCVGVWQKHIRI